MAETIENAIRTRILVLDGAMGTMIQRAGLAEADFRGELFRDHPVRLEGDNDILVLTRPDVIADIHRLYLEAGADIIETCTFNAQAVSQAEYRTAEHVARMNLAAARIARTEADRMSRLTPDRPRFVAGSIGPTGKTASMSPDVDNPAFRAVDFDTLRDAYAEQIGALVEGGVDLLLVETVFDTLNAKAALDAARLVFESSGRRLPVMLSFTIADAAGRTLSGQTPEALLASTAHADLFAVGLNCSFGAEQMTPYLRRMAEIAPCHVSAYPNAGIPDAMGRYDQTPEIMARNIGRFIDERIVNIVGGCCGSTPEHIRAIAAEAARAAAVRRPSKGGLPWLAGLDGFDPDGAFVNVGERCNVAGSRKFLRLIKEQSYDEALAIARRQVRDGAMVIDVNMDDGMIDARAEMTHFLNLMASDPETARVPWMIDSSRFEVIESALKCIQGKPIVNSLSLKEGEEVFLDRARRVRDMGAALVVMAFDEQGQATSFDRKVEVCRRAYRLLTERLGFDPHDIIFDPNVLTIATGMKEHDSYALDFIRATRWIRDNLPHAHVSGGVSNLSFSFRGNNYLREAMHAVFLCHAIRAGLDMAIVNPSTAVMYEDIPPELREALEDAILCRRDDAAERLVAAADKFRDAPETEKRDDGGADRRAAPLEKRLAEALRHGDDEHLEEDLAEALAAYPSAADIIAGPLMRGMTLVGELFGAGKMFLPQVVKTARTMKRATELLQPHIAASQTASAARGNGRYLLATVKGDVHDIGKNIVAVILACNGFEVIDLGVMTPAERIVEAAIANNVDYIGLSGLITPSLDEMCRVARDLREAGVRAPLFIGGATTSALHTAAKIAPLYDGPVFHVKDAAQNPVLAMRLAGDGRERAIACLRFEQEQLRQRMQREENASLHAAEALRRKLHIDWSKERLVAPTYEGVRIFDDMKIADVRAYINWTHFFNLWGVRRGTPEADKILDEAERLLDGMEKRHGIRAAAGFYPAYGTDDAIVVSHIAGCPCCGGVARRTVIDTPRQRRPDADRECLALADFVAPEGAGDHIGVFAVTLSASFVEELEQLKAEGRHYESLLMQSVGDRLAEAASERLHAETRRKLWGYAPDEDLTPKQMFGAAYSGIRPAVGYPSLPDQRAIFKLAELIDFASIGIRLTENGAMYPQASVCGLYLASPHAHYFIV